MRISDWSSDVCSSDLTVPASPLFAMFDVRAHHEEQPFARHDRGRHVGCGGRPRERRQIGTGLARKRPARAKMCGIACRSGLKIGRASVRERGCPDVYISVVAVSLQKKKTPKIR